MSTLRLHVDSDGIVWYGDDDTLATCSRLEPDEFVSSGIALNKVVTTIKILGCRSNGELIHNLSLARMFRDGLSIRVGSPEIVAREIFRSNPLLVLQYLQQRQYNLSGHWHELERRDFCTYSMIANLGNSQTVTEVVRRIATAHPAWPALTFINNLDVDTVCRLLCEIIDPRWYRHPLHPQRDTKLYAYLGLTPRNIRSWLAGTSPDRNFERLMPAVLSWYNPEGCTGTDAPGDFLWRCFDAQSDCVLGVLRATQLFVSYLSATWFASLSAKHPEVYFDANRFFKDDTVAAAFKVHMNTKRPV